MCADLLPFFMFCFIMGVYVMMCRLDAASKKLDSVPDWLLPPCQTSDFTRFKLGEQFQTGVCGDNQTTCDKYLLHLKEVEEKAEHERYLSNIETTINELKQRLDALERKPPNRRGPGCTCYIRNMEQVCECN